MVCGRTSLSVFLFHSYETTCSQPTDVVVVVVVVKGAVQRVKILRIKPGCETAAVADEQQDLIAKEIHD